MHKSFPCFAIPQLVPKQVLPPLDLASIEVIQKYLADFNGPHIWFWMVELSDLIVSSFHLTTIIMFSRTVTGVSTDSVALRKKQFLSVTKGHWYVFLFLYSIGQFYLVLPSSWLPQHVRSADLHNLIVRFCIIVRYSLLQIISLRASPSPFLKSTTVLPSFFNLLWFLQPYHNPMKFKIWLLTWF